MLKTRHILGTLLCFTLLSVAINKMSVIDLKNNPNGSKSSKGKKDATEYAGTINIKMKTAPPPYGVRKPLIPKGVPTTIIHTAMKKPKYTPNKEPIAVLPKDLGEFKWFNPNFMVPIKIKEMDKLYSEYSLGSKLGYVFYIVGAIIGYLLVVGAEVWMIYRGFKYINFHMNEMIEARFNQNLMAAQDKVIQHDYLLKNYNAVIKRTQNQKFEVYKTLGYYWRLINPITCQNNFVDEDGNYPKDPETKPDNSNVEDGDGQLEKYVNPQSKTEYEEYYDSVYNNDLTYKESTIKKFYSEKLPINEVRQRKQYKAVQLIKRLRNMDFKFLKNDKDKQSPKENKEGGCCSWFGECCCTFWKFVSCVWICLQCCKEESNTTKKDDRNNLEKAIEKTNQFKKDNPFQDPPIKLTDTFCEITTRTSKQKKATQQKILEEKNTDKQVLNAVGQLTHEHSDQIQNIFEEVDKTRKVLIKNTKCLTRQYVEQNYGKRSMQRQDFGFIKNNNKKGKDYEHDTATMLLSEPMIVEDISKDDVQSMDFRYFEVEIINQDKLGDIYIGFVNEGEYYKDIKGESKIKTEKDSKVPPSYCIGKQNSSVAFSLRGGEVWKAAQKVNQFNNEINLKSLYGYDDKYDYNFAGETIGVGINMKNGNCIVTLNGVVQNTFNPTNLTDITYNLIMGDNEDEYGVSEYFMGCFTKNKLQRFCYCIPHYCCCNLCIPDTELIADFNENEAVEKKGKEMLDDPKNYAKKYLNQKKNKKLKKAVEGIEKQTQKIKTLVDLVPAISFKNYSNCSVLINVGQAPFKFAHPECKTGIISKKAFVSEKSGDENGDDDPGFCSKLWGIDYGDSFGLGFLGRLFDSDKPNDIKDDESKGKDDEEQNSFMSS